MHCGSPGGGRHDVMTGTIKQLVTGPVGNHQGWNRRSRRLLVTTKTELNAIAAPAISGLSRPSGRHTTRRSSHR